jgi:uncharacterized membrane protein YfcA
MMLDGYQELPDALTWIGLVALGVAVGAYGTVVGAGGGFILAPLLLFLYPEYDPQTVTALSLGVAWVNAVSGTAANARQKRIDFIAGAIFAAGTVPSAFLGAIATGLLPRPAFEVLFGVFLLAIAAWLLVPKAVRIRTTPPPPRYVRRLLTDSQGDTYLYAFDPLLGGVLGVMIGFVSSLFGVGGGIIFVPVMILLLRIPSHIATATSTFTLIFTAGAGVLVHVLNGEYAGLIAEVTSLSAGVLIGAQLGALLAIRLAHRQAFVAALLSAALVIVGLRLLLGGLL